MINLEKYAPLIPLIYLIATAGIAAALHTAGLPDGVVGLIVGAGLMRVKIPTKK